MELTPFGDVFFPGLLSLGFGFDPLFDDRFEQVGAGTLGREGHQRVFEPVV